jgi:RNA-directed DNA polymerase
MQHVRDRIRELTYRRRLLLPIKMMVGDLDAFLGGWAA